MLKGFANISVRLVEKFIPDPFIIAVFLTLLTMALAWGLADFTPLQSVEAWGDGFWSLLRFTGQIILTFVLGHALANTGPVKAVLLSIAKKAKSATGAYILVGTVSAVACLLSWGLGLVAAAILSRSTAEAAREAGIKVHYPLLVACAYTGMVMWHMGFSGSIPLAVNTPGHFLEGSIGLIGVSDTLFTPMNMVVVALLVLTVPYLMSRLSPDADQIREFEGESPAEDNSDPAPMDHAPQSFAARLETSRWPNLIVVALGAVFLWAYFVARQDGLNLDILNFLFLMLGLALAKSPRHYLVLISNAARIAGPFLLQYPFYAGVMGMMAASGLGGMIAGFFVSIADADSLAYWSFLSAGLINMFIPSGGGQWAIQGPIVTEAALQLGADIPKVTMAVAMGDQWTNMIQPLFAIPALAIAGLHIRDIMGYCIIVLFYTALVFMGALYVF